jgi:hypothetical protein
VLDLNLAETAGRRVHAVVLRCQIRIEPSRRGYSGTEEDGLRDLFGVTGRWAETVRPLQLAQVAVVVPGFVESTQVRLPVPVTYDLEVAATKYFHALEDGEIPLLLLFSGTAFHHRDGALRVTQIPWDTEVRYRLPVRVWDELIEAHFPNSGWLRLERDTLRALDRYRSRHALPTWEQAFAQLLRDAGEAQ